MYNKTSEAFHLFPPHPSLRSHILFYHVVFPERDMFSADYTLMPDACGTLSLAFDGNSVQAELWGASVTPTVLGAEPNSYQVLLLIQLRPYGLYQMTRRNQAEFADKRLSLRDIDTELFCSLYNAFQSSDTPAELVRACERELYKRMQRQIVSNVVLQATGVVADVHGQIRVRDLAGDVGYSERQLNRLFLTQIGTHVKEYIRLVRFTHVLKHIQTSPCFFAALSQQAGYFDQAHFDKDFKAISGVTPLEYREKMSAFYYDAGDELGTLLSKE